MQIQPIISTHPDVRGSFNDSLVRAIEAAYGCAAVCHICVDACLAEDSRSRISPSASASISIAPMSAWRRPASPRVAPAAMRR